MWQRTFGRWGDPATPVTVKPGGERFIVETLGVPVPRPAVDPSTIQAPTSRLTDDDITALAASLGSVNVDTSRAARLQHAAGCSLGDYVDQRDAALRAVPDAVVRPASHAEVERVLVTCSDRDIAVVPFGGGTSVVGGVTALAGDHSGVIALDLARMIDVLHIDETSGLAVVQPGVTGPMLERLLEPRGLTWGHLPQSWERATIGGYAATRSAGQASSGFGRSDDTIEAVRMATPTGEVWLGRAPASAAGPDLRQLVIGSEGVLGVITEVTLRLRRRPAWERYEGLLVPSFAAGVEAFRELTQSGLQATVMRLSDEAETRSTLAMSGPSGRVGAALHRYLRARGVDGGCLVVLGWESASAGVGRARRKAAWQILDRHGAVGLGQRIGESWRSHRFSGPFLRDELLDRGYVVETLETATHWSGLLDLHADLTAGLEAALRSSSGGRAFVMTHVSHVYDTGASLYVTALAPAQADRRAQWWSAKSAASEVVTAAGATITHHHAVGTDHLPWMATEVGDLGLAALRAVKNAWDPAGVLNPGKLIPARPIPTASSRTVGDGSVASVSR
ncbi:MAG: FAD-binding oxidoreductase [Jiangellales bacterium]